MKLSKKEYDFLNKHNLLLNRKNYFKENQNIDIPFKDEECDIIYEYLVELLQKVGFNHEYDLTNDGNFIESLIEKFNV